MQIPEVTVAIEDLAEQECASVAETRYEPPELVACVGLGDRCGTSGHVVAHQQLHAIGAP